MDLKTPCKILCRPVFIAALAGGLGACSIGGFGGIGGFGKKGDNGPGITSSTGTVMGSENQAVITSAERTRKRKGVKVALLLPLSAKGNGGRIAKTLKQAGELALFDFDNPDIVLFAKDTRGTPEGAKAAAADAIRSGAELIVGPLFAKSVTAAAPVARQANVPMISFSSSESVAGENIYLLSFLAGRDVDRVISYAISQGKRRFAAVIPQNGYGKIVETAFRTAMQKHGGELLALEHIPADPNGMLEPMKRIAELASSKEGAEPQIDALFLPAGPGILPTLAPLLPYYEIDTKRVQIIGTGLWDYPNIGRQKPLIGGWFPAPDPKGWRGFTQRYAKTYGKPPDRLASLAYDAVSLSIALSANSRGTRFSKSHLTRRDGFAGVDGLFRLRGDGTSERGLAILEVQKFGPRVLDHAPSVFSNAQY